MADRHFRIVHPDGHHTYVTVPHGKRAASFGVPKGAKKISRLPGEHEHHDGERFVSVPEEQRARDAARQRFNAMDKGDVMLMLEDAFARIEKLEGAER